MAESIFRSMSSFTKQEIKILFKTAHMVYHENGIIIKRAPKSHEYAKILIVTPKKAGNAPQRNLMRRRLKHIFFNYALFEQPYDLIILVSSAANQLSFDELKTIILNLYENK